METTRREWRYFSIFQWRQEQDYLRERHRQGWRLTRVSFPGIYRFARCQPEDVVYQLDYNPEGRAHQAEYVRLFQDCGWTYLQDFAGYSYFCKPVACMQGGEEEIFCDEASRQAMQKRVLARRLPALIALLALCAAMLLLSAAAPGAFWEGAFTGICAGLILGCVALAAALGLRLRKGRGTKG